MSDAPQGTDVLDRIADLHKQATTEKSHYYTASTLEACSNEIKRLRAALNAVRTPFASTLAHEAALERLRQINRLTYI